MPAKKTKQKTIHAPVTTRNILFDNDDDKDDKDNQVQNPYKYGFSNAWMESVQIPKPRINYEKPDAALAVYGEFISEIRTFHGHHLGFTRWVVGHVVNRLKPITGRGEKEIPHGQFKKFIKTLNLSADILEESRWVAETFDRGAAETMTWTAMREVALKARAAKQGKTRKTQFGASRNNDPKAQFALPQMEKQITNDLAYYKKCLSHLPKPNAGSTLSGEGIVNLLATAESLMDILTKIRERVKSFTEKKTAKSKTPKARKSKKRS